MYGKWKLSKLKHEIQGLWDFKVCWDLYPQEEVQGLKPKVCLRGSELNIDPDIQLAH